MYDKKYRKSFFYIYILFFKIKKRRNCNGNSEVEMVLNWTKVGTRILLVQVARDVGTGQIQQTN